MSKHINNLARFIIVVSAVAVAVFFLYSFGLAQKKKIIVAGGDNFIPGMFLNADGKPDGMDVDLWNLWSEKTGIEIEFRLMEWSKTIPLLIDGKVDVVDGVSYTPKRAKLLDFSSPYGKITTYIFYQKSIGSVRGLGDLSGFPVGIVEGTHTVEFLSNESPGLRLVTYGNHEEMVKSALKGHIPVFIGEEPLISYFFAKSGQRIDYERTEKSILTADLRMAVRKGESETLALIEEGLSAISTEDKQSIKDAWTGISITSQIPWREIIWSLSAILFCIIVLVIWNVQLRKRVESAMNTLRASEEQFRLLIQTAASVILYLSPDGRILEFNSEAELLYGRKREEVLGENYYDLFVPESIRDDIVSDVNKVLSGEPTRGFENEVVAHDSRSLIILWNVNRVLDLKGQPIGVIAVGQDITERKHMDEALRESEKKYRTLIENIPDVVWTTDISGNTIFISPNIQDIYGYTAEEIYEAGHKLWFERIHPDDVERVKNKFYNLFNRGVPLDVEYRIRRKDEKWIWLLDRSTGTYVKDEILFADGLFSDITERKQAEDALRSSEGQLRTLASRLQEVEEDERKGLARELHDRVGPNLTGLSINLNLIRSQLSARSLERVADRLDDSMSLVEETTKRIRDVMAELRPEVLYDYGLIAALRWHCNEFEKRTGISTILQGNNLTLRMPEYVESAIFRIAQEALTNVSKHAEVKLVTLAFANMDGMFRLTITDDGKGFDYTALSKSIKQKGWGLLIMQERSQAFGGQIHIESEPGKGTRIIVDVKL